MKKAIIKTAWFLFKKSQFRFVLKGGNNEIIAVSETYTQKHNCISVIKKYFPDFIIEDQT